MPVMAPNLFERDNFRGGTSDEVGYDHDSILYLDVFASELEEVLRGGWTSRPALSNPPTP